MTDINVDALIAEARRAVESLGVRQSAMLINRLADALEQVRRSADEWWKQYDAERVQREMAERERDEALAVIERAKARVADARLDGTGREDGTWNEALAYAARQLATAPADALRERDAANDLADIQEAWLNPGPRPDYHEHVKGFTRRRWPTLTDAIERSLL